jgi:putative addiction module component (TIGR02574 family)
MSDYDSVRADAIQLALEDRLRLIDELASSVPDDEPVKLHDAWLEEIRRRSAEIDAQSVTTEPWEHLRARLLAKLGVNETN